MKEILFLILLLSLPLAKAEFTEIMYDPAGSDAGREWVEYYGHSLDGHYFYENAVKHHLNKIAGECQGTCLSIIADDAERFLREYTVSKDVLIYDASFSLKNTGEEICLANKTAILECLTYPAISASAESIQLIDGQYESARPSPGSFEKHEEEAVPEFTTLFFLVLLVCLALFIQVKRKGLRGALSENE